MTDKDTPVLPQHQKENNPTGLLDKVGAVVNTAMLKGQSLVTGDPRVEEKAKDEWNKGFGGGPTDNLERYDGIMKEAEETKRMNEENSAETGRRRELKEKEKKKKQQAQNPPAETE